MTSTVYRDPHGTSTVKFGTAVYCGYLEYRPSLICCFLWPQKISTRCQNPESSGTENNLWTFWTMKGLSPDIDWIDSVIYHWSVWPVGWWSATMHGKIRFSVCGDTDPGSTVLLCYRQFSESGCDLHGVSQSSLSRCISAVAKVLNRHASQFIWFPTGGANQQRIKAEFYDIAAFLNLLWCVEGTQITIIAPPKQYKQVYICHKGFHSVNVEDVCDAQPLSQNTWEARTMRISSVTV